MIFVVQTRRIGEVGFLAAERGRLFVHECGKGFSASGAVLGECIGDFVCGTEQEGVEGFPDRNPVADAVARTRGTVLDIVDGIIRKGDGIV